MRVRSVDFSFALHGLCCVAHDIEYDLDQLFLVAVQLRQTQIVIALNQQIVRHLGQHHAAHAFEYLMDIERV